MGYTPRYRKGDWKVICDRCGLQFHASELRRTWDGLYVCRADYEPRHPQDFVKGIPDKQSVPWTRTEGTFVLAGDVSVGTEYGNDEGDESTTNSTNYVSIPVPTTGERFNTITEEFEDFPYYPFDTPYDTPRKVAAIDIGRCQFNGTFQFNSGVAFWDIGTARHKWTFEFSNRGDYTGNQQTIFYTDDEEYSNISSMNDLSVIRDEVTDAFYIKDSDMDGFPFQSDSSAREMTLSVTWRSPAGINTGLHTIAHKSEQNATVNTSFWWYVFNYKMWLQIFALDPSDGGWAVLFDPVTPSWNANAWYTTILGISNSNKTYFMSTYELVDGNVVSHGTNESAFPALGASGVNIGVGSFGVFSLTEIDGTPGSASMGIESYCDDITIWDTYILGAPNRLNIANQTLLGDKTQLLP